MVTLKNLKEKRRRIPEIAAQYGAANVRVFGSVVRGDAGPNRDVGFLVKMETGRSAFDLGGLLMDLQDLLGCEVGVVTERGLNQHRWHSLLILR